MSPKAYASDARRSTWMNALSHVLLWLLLAVAGLLLVGMMAVLEDIAQKGDMRHLHQRSSGTLMLPDEFKASDFMLSPEKPAQRAEPFML